MLTLIRKSPFTFVAVVGVLFAGGWFIYAQFAAPDAAAVDYNDATAIAQGKQLYGQYCASCHGPNGEGELPAQPMGGQRADGTYIAPAMTRTGHAWHHGPDTLFSVIKDGSPAKGSPMVGWGGTLDDEQIHAVIAYIRSLWPMQLRERYDSAFGIGSMGRGGHMMR